jgi:hypothetical protein
MVEPILGEGGQGVNRIHCRCKMAAASPFAHVLFGPNTPAKSAQGFGFASPEEGFCRPVCREIIKSALYSVILPVAK